MKFPENKIIAFEGLDCSFKETNHKAFIARLKKEFPESEKNIFVESFPRYSDKNWAVTGVNKWLQGELDRNHMKEHPFAVDSLYSIDRLSYWFETATTDGDILYNNREGNTFIFDRYNMSNAIYNPLNKEETTYDDLMFDNKEFGIPNPDIIVWMRMYRFDAIATLLAHKKNKDKNELDTSFLEEVWNRSENLIKSTELFDKCGIKLIVVDCLNNDDGIVSLKSKEEIEEFVWNSIMDAI